MWARAERAFRRLVAGGMERHEAVGIVRVSLPDEAASEGARVARLEREGMDPRFIRRAKPPPRARARDPVPAAGPDGIHHHGPECACWWCD